MKKQLLRLAAIGALVLGFGSAQAQTGTDPFGYIWRGQTAAGGPTYNWIEISTTGTQVAGLADDNFVGPFAMPNFTYYWNNFNTFTIGSNGYIRLGDNGLLVASGATGFVDWPGLAPGTNIISPMCSDLTFVTQPSGGPAPNAGCFYEVQGSKLIVQWQSVPHWTPNAANQISGANTFQVILDGADSSIVYQYKQLSGTVNSSYTQYNKGGNSGPVAGLGVNLFRNRPLVANLAFKYSYPRNSTYRFEDASVNWVHNPENLATVAYKGQPMQIVANIRNSGTVNHSSRLRIFLNLIDPTGNVVLQDTVAFGGILVKGKDTTITFRKNIPTSLPADVYTAQITTRMTRDQLLANNEEVSKISLVDSNAAGEIKIRYDYNDFNALKNLGSSAGNSFDMPFYPARIVAVEFVSSWPEAGAFTTPNVADSLTPFNVALYNGTAFPTAATQLVSFVVDKPTTDATISQVADTLGTETQGTVVTGYYVAIRRTLPIPINVTSGRIYMGVSQNRTTRFFWNGLVRDTITPTSGRAFEITAGVWAPNRDKANIELPFRLILKSSNGTITSGPRAEQYVAIGNLYPNPAKGRAILPLNLRTAGDVTIRLVASNGAVVREEAMGYQPAGKNEVAVNLSDLNPGLYLYQVNTPDGVFTKRIVVK